MAGIMSGMHSLLSSVRVNYVFLLFFLVLSRLSLSSIHNEASTDSNKPEYLFRKLLQQYSGAKTQLILCSLSSSLNAGDAPAAGARGPTQSTVKPSILTRCRTGDTSLDALRPDSLIDPKINREVLSRCRFGGDGLVRCLSKDAFVSKILGDIEHDLKPGLDRMCCLLNGCGLTMTEGAGQTGGRTGEQTGGQKATRKIDPCLGCMSEDAVGRYNPKIASSDQESLLHSLSGMFCSELKYSNVPCTKLNLVALNLMSGPTERKILGESVDILTNCCPSFASQSLRLFQIIAGNLSVNDTSRIKALLTPQGPDIKPSSVIKFWSGENGVTKERMSDLTARAKTGLVVMAILITMSIVMGGWVIYQKARLYFHPDEAVRYSQININDIYIDDPNRDEDEDDDDPGEGVPTPYRP